MSACFEHRGHRVSIALPRAGEEVRDTGVAGPPAAGGRGTAAREAVDDWPGVDDWPSVNACGVVCAESPDAAAAPLRTPTWAAEAVIGLPQSMQNREVASFSRPQNEQTVNRHPPRRETHMAREYRTVCAVREG